MYWLKYFMSVLCKHIYCFWCVGVCLHTLSHVWFFVTPRTVARQAPLSMGFSRQEYWSGLAFPSQEDLPNPRTELGSPVSPALAGLFFITVPPGKPYGCGLVIKLCSILWDPVNYSWAGSFDRWFFRARILDWIAVSFAREAFLLYKKDS